MRVEPATAFLFFSHRTLICKKQKQLWCGVESASQHTSPINYWIGVRHTLYVMKFTLYDGKVYEFWQTHVIVWYPHSNNPLTPKHSRSGNWASVFFSCDFASLRLSFKWHLTVVILNIIINVIAWLSPIILVSHFGGCIFFDHFCIW